ncbi:MAG: MmcQ/YjbR family DNA-binding protein [Armatimonadetes bacterium]|nr:MmcQ/YjbR family DNA-binding protein [Armatimonadota bacterium]MDE2207559.1 MmcQ/YjbR family DNA-binding protein [Armatimonadota bacterium]
MIDKDETRARLARTCELLPEADVVPGQHITYRVRGKTFAWLCDNHHNDGKYALWLKAAPGEQQLLVAADPAVFFVPPYVGPNGWVGVRLDVGETDWEEVAALMRSSYRLLAPKRLAAQVPGE